MDTRDIWIWLLVGVPVLAAATRVVLRIPPRIAAPALAAAPVLALPLWRAMGVELPFFNFIKVYSVGLGAAYILALKFTRWIDRPWGRPVAYAILAVNILEAVVADAVQGGAINSVAGLLLIAAQPAPSTIRVDRDSPTRDLIYPVGWLWAVSYTVWDWVFISANQVSGAFAVFHLAAPFLVMGGRSDRYIQARAVSLALILLMRLTAPYPPFYYLSPAWHLSPACELALRIASLALATGAFWRSRRARPAARRREPLTVPS